MPKLAVVRVPNSRDLAITGEGQIRLVLARGVNRSAAKRDRSGIWRWCGESGQASLNARGVRPVQRRNDLWNAAGSEYCRKNAMSPMLKLRS